MFFIKKIKNKIILTLFVFIAIFLHYQQLNVAGPDMELNITSGISLAKGKGISVPYIDASDWTKIQYHTLGDWAPGIAVSTALLYFFTSNYFFLVYGQALIYLLIFFVFCYLILSQVGFKRYKIHITLLFMGVFYAPIQYLGLSGYASLSTFLAGIYLCIVWVQREKIEKAISVVRLFITGFVLFLPSFFRFAYYPSGFSIIISYIVYKFLYKEEIYTKNVAVVATSLVFFTVCQLYYQNSIEVVNFLENRDIFEKKQFLHFQNLQLISPIFLDTFYPSSIWIHKFNSYFKPSERLENIVLLARHVFSLFLFVLSFSMFKRFWLQADIAKRSLFIFLITTATINFLFMLSLTLYYPAWMEGNRTFLTLERYLTPVLLLTVLTVIVSYQEVKWGRFFIFSILAFNILIYSNSIRNQDMFGLVKEKNNLPKDIAPYFINQHYTFILSDNPSLRMYPISLGISDIAFGSLGKYIRIANERGYNASKHIKGIAIYTKSNTSEIEIQLKKTFGSENVKPIQLNAPNLSFWEIQLLPTN